MPSNPIMQSYPADQQIDFLFVTYGGGHVKMVLPIAEKLIKEGYSVQIFALTTAIDILKKSSVPYFSYKNLPIAKNLDVISQVVHAVLARAIVCAVQFLLQLFYSLRQLIIIVLPTEQ